MIKLQRFLSGKPGKGFPVFILLVGFCLSSLAQKSEIGAGIGALTYTGDLSPTYRIQDNRPGGILYYRNNLSNVVSLRYAITGGMLQGNDNNAVDVFGALRDASFDIIILEPSVTIEYNFLDYKEKNSIIDFSPYFFAGAGFFTFFGQEASEAEYSTIQPTIPFGLGMKYNLSRNWRLNFEFGARMTFFDYIDNISEPIIPDKNTQYGNPFDKDTYYFFGISLSYAFYPVICPFDYND